MYVCMYIQKEQVWNENVHMVSNRDQHGNGGMGE